MKSVRSALTSEHAAIAAHPKDASNYVSLAYTLSDAGMEAMARDAAADATRVAPKSSFAYSARGWVLHHNDAGVDYGAGFDYDGSLQAYQRAIELDPTDLSVRESLGNLLDHNRKGIDHAVDAHMGLAIEVYRYVLQHQTVPSPDTARNLALDLFYTGQYEQAIKELAHLPLDNIAVGALLASVAASQGPAATIQLSNQIVGDEQRRKDSLNMAAEGLWNKRLYPAATDLMTASLPDANEGPEIAAKIQIFRNLKPYVSANLPSTDPRRPVQTLMEKALSGTLDEAAVREFISSHSYATGDLAGAVERQSEELSTTLFALMKQTQLPLTVVGDIVLGRMIVTASPGAGSGRSIRVQVPGLPLWQFFVVAEDGTWKIAAGQRETYQVGEQALYLLENGKEETARVLLDWNYSQLDALGAANDPLGGSLFARLWAPTERTKPQAALIAAASLSSDEDKLRGVLPVILKARDKASTERRRDDLDRLLATIYIRLRDAPSARAVCLRLLEKYPDSATALHLAGEAYALSKDWNAWKAMLARALKAEPSDRTLLLESAAEAMAEGEYARARQAYQAILDGSHMTSADYTEYAWISLFAGTPDDKAYAAAQQGTLSAAGKTYKALLTMACLDAARGSTAEARQELLDAMTSAHLTQPDGGVWYGFGRIFEEYGATDAAVSAYQKAVQIGDAEGRTKPFTSEAPVALLAAQRLKALGAK